MSSYKMATAFKGLSVSGQVIGEKGTPMHSSTGSLVMDLNHSVDQSSTKEDIGKFLDNVLNNAKTSEEIMLLVITILNKRQPRVGEGCKDTGFELILQLYEKGYPQLVISLMEFIPEFGCSKDWWKIIGLINKRLGKCKINETYFNKYNPLVEAIIANFWKYINGDLQIYNEWKEKYSELSEVELMEKRSEIQYKLSTAGKYAPREKSSITRNTNWWIPIYNKETETIITFQKQQLRKMLIRWKYQPYQEKIYMSIGLPSIKSTYQKAARASFSLLNEVCEVCEVKTCSGQWSKIVPSKAPSGFLMKQRKAWLNETKKTLESYELKTGNRYPDNLDRVRAREILLTGLEKVNGGVLAPYEFIRQIKSGKLSTTEMIVLEAQWKAMISEVRKNIKDYIKELRVKAAVDAGLDPLEVAEVTDEDIEEVLVMIDVSGSMTCAAAKGITCMDLAVSLGMAAADLNTGEYKNMAMSYSAEPRLFYFVHPDGREYSLLEKYNEIMSDVGYTTDIGKAMDLVLKIAVKESIPEEDLPTLLILSDGQFDQQIMGPVYSYGKNNVEPTSKWDTTYTAFERKFIAAGYSKPSMINFWNLNADYANPRTYGFQENKDRKGVSMIQGWNNSSFKMVMSGQEVIAPAGENASKLKDNKSAWDDFQGMTKQDHYIWAKELMSASEEGLLKDYTFEEEIGEGRTPTTLMSLRSRGAEVAEAMEAIEVIEVAEVAVAEAMEAIDVDEVAEAMDTCEVPEQPKTWSQTLFGNWNGTK